MCVPHPVSVGLGIIHEASCMLGMNYTNGAPAPAPAQPLVDKKVLHSFTVQSLLLLWTLEVSSAVRVEPRVRLECRLGPAAFLATSLLLVPIATDWRRLVFTLPFVSQGLGCGTGLCAHKVGKCRQSARKQTLPCSAAHGVSFTITSYGDFQWEFLGWSAHLEHFRRF